MKTTIKTSDPAEQPNILAFDDACRKEGIYQATKDPETLLVVTVGGERFIIHRSHNHNAIINPWKDSWVGETFFPIETEITVTFSTLK